MESDRELAFLSGVAAFCKLAGLDAADEKALGKLALRLRKQADDTIQTPGTANAVQEATNPVNNAQHDYAVQGAFSNDPSLINRLRSRGETQSGNMLYRGVNKGLGLIGDVSQWALGTDIDNMNYQKRLGAANDRSSQSLYGQNEQAKIDSMVNAKRMGRQVADTTEKGNKAVYDELVKSKGGQAQANQYMLAHPDQYGNRRRVDKTYGAYAGAGAFARPQHQGLMPTHTLPVASMAGGGGGGGVHPAIAQARDLYQTQRAANKTMAQGNPLATPPPTAASPLADPGPTGPAASIGGGVSQAQFDAAKTPPPPGVNAESASSGPKPPSPSPAPKADPLSAESMKSHGIRFGQAEGGPAYGQASSPTPEPVGGQAGVGVPLPSSLSQLHKNPMGAPLSAPHM